ncbi:MAG: hypothetical protein AAFX50_05820 [Acidobacteriota bacterium]
MTRAAKPSALTRWSLVSLLAAGLAWPTWAQDQGEGARSGVALLEESAPEDAEQGPTLGLADELGPTAELGVGRSLDIAGAGFEAAADLHLVLADAAGVPVVEAEVRTDAEGRFVEKELWPRTGIRGCDCDFPPAAYAFRTYEGALQALTGVVFTLTAREPASGRTVAVRDLTVAAPKGIVGFVSDATGCPRSRFADDEDVYFRAVNSSLDHRFDVTLTTARLAPLEMREEQPEGDTFDGHGPSTLVRVWAGSQSHLGEFILQVDASGWPHTIQIFKEDGINSGIVEDDPACLVPPP